jgi:putative ABC transport system ATP-binding protein
MAAAPRAEPAMDADTMGRNAAAGQPTIDLADVSLALSARGRATGRFELAVPRFSAWRGEAIALVGESGSGKSTLLNLIGLAQRPDRAGTFMLGTRDGAAHDIAALWRRGADAALTTLRAHHQGYVLQQGGLLPFLSVRGNIGLALDLAGRPDRGAVAAVAASLGIARLLDRGIGEISVGQRQRVAIARALVHEPDMILADEPTANVHPSMADEVLGLLREQAQRHQALLVMATHDVGRAAGFGFTFVEVVPEPVPGEPDATRSTVTRHAAAPVGA